jgi:hypothetical protein
MASGISKKADTKLSGAAIILSIVMILNVATIILLTPAGFETRPQSDLKTLGYVAIAAIFIGLALDIVAIGLLFKRVRIRLASSLAIITSATFLLIILVDRTGSFFSVPTPPAINTLEYVLAALSIVTILLASKVLIESKPASSR